MVKHGMVLNNVHYIQCSICGKDLGTDEELEKSDWSYCPRCGEPLFEDEEIQIKD